ncbi:MAG: putative Hydrolase domain [Pseudomonadota bacterium]
MLVVLSTAAFSVFAQEAQPIAAPPSYLGTINAQFPCSQSFPTLGYEPAHAEPTAKHPLFIYLCGTEKQIGANYDSDPALAVAQAMAKRGFVALTASYDNGRTASAAKSRCLFDPEQREGLLAQACALPNVDCNLGVAVWGHSQGGALALTAANFAKGPGGTHLVRAAWATGVSLVWNTNFALPKDRIRLLNGRKDFPNAFTFLLERITGLDAPSQCVGGANQQCLRANGSGWVIVNAVPGVIGEDHCWFQAGGCTTTRTVAPGFGQPGSRAAYSLELNADWVAATAATPW